MKPADRHARADALALFDAVAQATRVGEGVTRESYGASESAALGVLCDWARVAGLVWHTDLAGNVIFESPVHDAALPAVVCGSHVDSVPEGGNFDGLAGIVAGLLVLRDLHAAGRPEARHLRVAALRGEESAWFGKAYMGSSAALGCLDAHYLELRHRDGARRLGESMQAQGAQPEAIARGERARWTEPERMAAWLELHIEQGPVLIDRDWPIAVVTGIRGNVRYPRLQCVGEAGHSGAVPRHLRHDAVLATADLLGRLESLWTDELAAGRDLVFTSGIIATDSRVHASSRIPDGVRLSVEARSTDPRVLADFERRLHAACACISRDRGVSFDLGEPLYTAPAAMNDELARHLHAGAAQLGIVCGSVASGAGHDAALFANAGIPSAMIFIRNANGSHNPHEAMDIDDFIDGTRVLEQAVLARLSKPTPRVALAA